jgi:hypothetical protein
LHVQRGIVDRDNHFGVRNRRAIGRSIQDNNDAVLWGTAVVVTARRVRESATRDGQDDPEKLRGTCRDRHSSIVA